MKLEENICNKFPVVLRDKLLNNTIELPDDTQFEYEKIKTYRAVARKVDDFHTVTRNDFKSYFELGKKPKARGVKDPEKDPRYYGVSSSLSKEIVEQKMRFPNPNKKMAVGYVYCEGGPELTEDQHVCWWLYEGVDLSGFKLI